MRAWPEVEALATNAVRGIVTVDGCVDEHRLECTAISYLRGVFFTKCFRALRNRSAQFEQFAKAHDEIAKGDAPGRALITQVYCGIEPCSLEGIFRLKDATIILRDRPSPGEKNAEFAAMLRRAFPRPDILAPGSIIPSLHTPDLDQLREIRLKADGVDRVAFSRRLLEGTPIHLSARPGFIVHLEDGYTLAKGREPGRYRLTEQTASVVYKQLEGVGVRIPPLEELIPISASGGPRSGQVSKGLPATFGNLVP